MAPFTARSRSSASSVLTTLDGGVARGYAGIPQVERAVAVHLCPRNAATWRNRPRLPSKACKLTTALAAKAYSAAGQAASALHAMDILQVHQAKALKQVHEGSTDPGLMQELRTVTDFALRATKVTARSLGKAMSTMVVQERHLWLNLAEMKDVDKARLLDAPISQGGLFGDTVHRHKRRVPCVRAGLLSRCLETPAWIRAQGSHHALLRSGGEPASTALGGGRSSLSVAVSRKSIAHIRDPHPERQKLRAALCLPRRAAEREGCLQTEVGTLDSWGRRLGVPVARRAVPPGGEGSLHQECCLLPCVGARCLFGRHLQSCGLGDTEHLRKILQSSRWASFFPCIG